VQRLAAGDGFEVKGRPAYSPSGTPTRDEVQSTLKNQFGALATDKEQFHDTLRTVYGESYDAQKAEGYRQKALARDYSWLPPVKWVGADVLGQANGCYDRETGTVFLNATLQGNPALAGSTYVEEAGHHLDTKLNASDAQGDEGELFRRVLSGEKLTQAQISEIRSEDDSGTIEVDGRKVEVEFWNPFKAIGNAVSSAAKAVGGAVSSAAKAVGGAVASTAKAVGSAAVSVASGVAGGAKMFATGIAEGAGGFFSNIVRGNVSDAFQSLVRGADKAFLQAPLRIVNGAFDGADHLLKGATGLLGPLGKPLYAVGSRLIDGARTLTETANGLVRDGFRTATETPLALFRGVEESVKLAAQGKWGDAALRFGQGFLDAGTRLAGNLVDGGARLIQGAAGAVLTVAFLEKPTRGLTGEEKQLLRSVYGDSLDYDSIRLKESASTEVLGMAPHTIGNTIYVPKEWGGKPVFNDDGSLTQSGKELLIHETCHAWQNQNGGGDYIHRSLISQGMAALGGGSRDGAYNWREGVKQGKPWSELNPEQQASLIEDLGTGLLNDGKFTVSDIPGLSAAEFAYMQSAWQQLRQGAGG
jgi:hypothetical protein